MGIVKISDEIHEELRQASQVMSRSINAQAEFWIKMGRLAELNPDKTFAQIIKQQLNHARSDTIDSGHDQK
ncbi:MULTISPECIES: ParD-like family protein [unclassified Pseudoalteromonas]|uniref:ParD-like family protein n=1 Tax=unclassified Pseudoalteromonas TaxID=194690 RepID=UPI002097ED8D|nr:ParD-like family protein [Pseudoalteromonas sp. XMcav2-N]MCO7187279.1 ParD-like family protein [Pseudoalteromonas sp. XMcav2-N]